VTFSSVALIKVATSRNCRSCGNARVSFAISLWDMETRPKGALATALRALMQTQFTKAADRALFDLPPLPKPEAASAATDAPAASGARKAPVDAGSDKG